MLRHGETTRTPPPSSPREDAFVLAIETHCATLQRQLVAEYKGQRGRLSIRKLEEASRSLLDSKESLVRDDALSEESAVIVTPAHGEEDNHVVSPEGEEIDKIDKHVKSDKIDKHVKSERRPQLIFNIETEQPGSLELCSVCSGDGPGDGCTQDDEGDRPTTPVPEPLHFNLATVWHHHRVSRFTRRGALDFTHGHAFSRLKRGMSTVRVSKRGGVVKALEEDDEDPYSEFVMQVFRFMMKYIMVEPYSYAHLFWEISSFVMLTYDIITRPLFVFSPPETSFSIFMDWVIRLFWTSDIFVNLLTGYVDRMGSVVTFPPRVAWNYAVTQLHLDVLVVVMDWGEDLLDSFLPADDTQSRITLLKSWRLVRVARLLRFVKAKKILERFHEYVYTEGVIVIAGICKMLALMLLLLHFIACSWYGIGELSHSQGQPTWITPVKEGTVSDRYLRAFHFAIAIFSGEHIDIPQNAFERAFTVCVLYIAFVCQIWFVGSITTRMTHLEITATRLSSMFFALDRFLSLTGVSRELSVKVHRNARYALLEQEKNTQEEHIELLQVIAPPLLVELHYEIRCPLLQAHPFFKCYNEISPSSLRKVCHQAITFINMSSGEVFFHEEEIATEPRMYFPYQGEFEYRKGSNPYSSDQKILPRTWLAEPCLWTEDWVHFGTLIAASEHCVMMALDAVKFQDIMSTFGSPHVRGYAEDFVCELNTMDRASFTDVGEITPWLARLIQRSFSDEWYQVKNTFTSKAELFIRRSSREARVCRCGNHLLHDSEFCRKCGRQWGVSEENNSSMGLSKLCPS
eukprot:TRINITY_DN10325_c1_g1_i4.p1 TRINITY_DN10325_c1_g1~~TRINITY_DN10325_c1_g1_i4.p1  ORF type:complete len:799 (+),score=125.81 TRINITY_DN10325_c1_g1_i4:64-2460(+)